MKTIKLMGIVASIEKWESQKGTRKIKIGISHYLPKLIAELKEMEGARFEGNNLWTVKDCARNNFTFDILSKGEYNGESLRYIGSPSVADTAKTKCSLWDHQYKAFRFKIARRRCIDAEEMGLGKTLSTLEAIKYLKEERNYQGEIWWIAPNSGLTSLRTQLQKWGFSQVLVGARIFNYHGLEREMEEVDIPPQIVVFDECHALKNSGARRTQLAMQLTEIMEQYYENKCCIFGLSGTPSPENYFDWWSICEVIRPGWLKEGSFNRYKYRIGEFEQRERIDGGMYPHFTGWKQEEINILPKRLESLVFVAWKKDCLDLPEKIYEQRILDVPEDMKRVARALIRSGKRAVEIQILSRQLSDGFQYVPSQQVLCSCSTTGFGCFDCSYTGKVTKPESIAWGSTPKDDALKDLLDEHLENEVKRIVIYAAFTASVDRCVKMCQEKGWNVWRYDGRGQQFFFRDSKSKSIRDGEGEGKSLRETCSGIITETIFQDLGEREPIAFVGNPEAAGQGLTLTPAPTIVYFSNSFKSQFRVQSEDRIHRPGASKERGCRIIDLICLPTDRLILEKVKEKRSIEEITLHEIEEALR